MQTLIWFEKNLTLNLSPREQAMPDFLFSKSKKRARSFKPPFFALVSPLLISYLYALTVEMKKRGK